jgi:hypothetical protein
LWSGRLSPAQASWGWREVGRSLEVWPESLKPVDRPWFSAAVGIGGLGEARRLSWGMPTGGNGV